MFATSNFTANAAKCRDKDEVAQVAATWLVRRLYFSRAFGPLFLIGHLAPEIKLITSPDAFFFSTAGIYSMIYT